MVPLTRLGAAAWRLEREVDADTGEVGKRPHGCRHALGVDDGAVETALEPLGKRHHDDLEPLELLALVELDFGHLDAFERHEEVAVDPEQEGVRIAGAQVFHLSGLVPGLVEELLERDVEARLLADVCAPGAAARELDHVVDGAWPELLGHDDHAVLGHRQDDGRRAVREAHERVVGLGLAVPLERLVERDATPRVGVHVDHLAGNRQVLAEVIGSAQQSLLLL